MKKIIFSKYKKKIKVIANTEKIIVQGPLGTLDYFFPKNENSYSYQENLNFKLFWKQNNLNLLKNKIEYLFKSVSNGWFLELNLNGIGYKCFKKDNEIILDMGYSNLIVFKPTNRIQIKIFKNKIMLFSIDKNYLNNVGYLLRKFAIPDSYKGKGILFKNELIKLKKKNK